MQDRYCHEAGTCVRRVITCISATFICVLDHGSWRIDCGEGHDAGLFYRHSPNGRIAVDGSEVEFKRPVM